MNKHLSKYLTSESKLLRNWCKSRINRTDQKYEVLWEVLFDVPKENQYVYKVDLYSQRLKDEDIKVSVIYCEKFFCGQNQLTKLPNLPVCKELYCQGNRITKLPDLPVCELLYCTYNQLKSLPKLPACKNIYCGGNNSMRLLPYQKMICKDRHLV